MTQSTIRFRRQAPSAALSFYELVSHKGENMVPCRRILFHVSQNPVFDSVYKALVSSLRDRWGKIKCNEFTEALASQGHPRIYRAVSRSDPDAAKKAMKKHLVSSWAV